jgi:hypothetical protein
MTRYVGDRLAIPDFADSNQIVVSSQDYLLLAWIVDACLPVNLLGVASKQKLGLLSAT